MKTHRLILMFSVVLSFIFFSSCATQVKPKGPVSYHYSRGKTALLQGKIAYPPKNAPEKIKKAIAAANRLTLKPYKWGGGHALMNDRGYDCSGSVSYVLREAGLLHGAMPSAAFYLYGNKGPGEWINIYVKRGHVFMTIAGLRFDTGGDGARTGPRWKPQRRSTAGCVIRHPSGY